VWNQSAAEATVRRGRTDNSAGRWLLRGSAAMNHFHYRAGVLCAEDVPLTRIADAIGTPTYVYSTATLERHFRVLTETFRGEPHLLCYSVKASSNVSLLRLFARMGAGFDIVSGGELHRVLSAGADSRKVVFSGVGKSEEEMASALKAGILLFNVESAEELEVLDAVGARLKKQAPFAIRVNPDIDARTHRYIATGLRTSKFGVPIGEAVQLYEKSRRMKGVVARGVDCHIGSQLTDMAPLELAVNKTVQFYRALVAKGFALQLIDIGGGLGIRYAVERPPSPKQYAAVVRRAVRGTGAEMILEPGRIIAGNAGVLLTRVLYRKRTPAKTFVVMDAGMNDLIRPALYGAHHELRPVMRRSGRSTVVDVVGPVCESSDVLARHRRLVLPQRGDLWAVMSAGAYGMSMASNYNSRPRPAEVLVAKNRFRVIRARETSSDLVRGEL
jgi:diaminopimelate decarboxylase